MKRVALSGDTYQLLTIYQGVHITSLTLLGSKSNVYHTADESCYVGQLVVRPLGHHGRFNKLLEMARFEPSASWTRSWSKWRLRPLDYLSLTLRVCYFCLSLWERKIVQVCLQRPRFKFSCRCLNLPMFEHWHVQTSARSLIYSQGNQDNPFKYIGTFN